MTTEKRRLRPLAPLQPKRQFSNDQSARKQQPLNEMLDRKQSVLYGVLNTKQEQIIQAGVQLLDDNGLSNLSLRKLAESVNMKAPALYWHFKNKELLVDYIAEAILLEEFADFTQPTNDEPWQSWILGVMQKLRTAMLSHTDGARVVAGAHIEPTITLARIMDGAIQAVHDSGLDLIEAKNVVMTALHYTFGHVIEEQSSPTIEDMTRDIVLQKLNQFESLAAAVKQTWTSGHSADDEFKAGITLITNGIE